MTYDCLLDGTKKALGRRAGMGRQRTPSTFTARAMTHCLETVLSMVPEKEYSLP